MKQTAKSVVRELEELQRVMESPSGRPLSGLSVLDTEFLSDNTESIKSYSIALNGAEKSVDKLGRAIEAAEEEMEAALKRTNEVHRSQLKQKDIELQELRRVLNAKDKSIDSLRETLSAAKRTYEGRLGQAEATISQRELEISSLQSELVVLREDRVSLEMKLQQTLSVSSRNEQDARLKEAQIVSSEKQFEEDREKLLEALQREQKSKKLLKIEAEELRRELDGSIEESRRLKQQAYDLSGKVANLTSLNKLLEEQLEKERNLNRNMSPKAAQLQQLERELHNERAVRKACERWLRAEIKGREEMEPIWKALQESAVLRMNAGTDMREAHNLLSSMQRVPQAMHVHKREFDAMKRQLENDSLQLKAEIDVARQLLSDRLRQLN